MTADGPAVASDQSGGRSRDCREPDRDKLPGSVRSAENPPMPSNEDMLKASLMVAEPDGAGGRGWMESKSKTGPGLITKTMPLPIRYGWHLIVIKGIYSTPPGRRQVPSKTLLWTTLGKSSHVAGFQAKTVKSRHCRQKIGENKSTKILMESIGRSPMNGAFPGSSLATVQSWNSQLRVVSHENAAS